MKTATIALFIIGLLLLTGYLMQLNKHIGELITQNNQLKIELVKQKNITDNAYRTITLFDHIAGANRDATKQRSQRTAKSQQIIKQSLPTNSCADEYIPDAITQQLRQQVAHL